MWSLNDVHSYVINLDRRPERWTAVLSQPDAKRIPHLERYSAVDGKNINVDTDSRISTVARYNIKNFTRRSHDMLDSIGGVGCALSHIGLWSKLVDSDQNVFLILEDDVLLPKGTWERVEAVYTSAPNLSDSTSWDIWSIGNLNCNSTMGNAIQTGGRKSQDRSEWVQCREFIGLQAYFISRTGAEKLLKEVYPIQQHIDWFITYYASMRPFKIIHNRYININQPQDTSDIAKKTTCAICDVPTSVDKTHWLVPKISLDLAMVGLTGAVLLLALFAKKK